MEANLGLVDNLVRAVASRVPEYFDREDLRQAGVMGLMQAAERWKPARNSSFEAYAVKRVRGSIWDLVRGRAYREATFDPIDQPHCASGHLGTLSCGGINKGHTYNASTSQLMDEHCDRNAQMDRVYAAMGSLTPAAARVLMAHYLEDKSLHSLQKELGVRSGRISQMHLRALVSLRETLAANG